MDGFGAIIGLPAQQSGNRKGRRRGGAAVGPGDEPRWGRVEPGAAAPVPLKDWSPVPRTWLSVGIEDVEDLWRDLAQALDAATAG